METVGHNVSTFVLWFLSVLGGLLNFDLPVGIKFGQLLFTPILLVMLFYMIFAFFGIDMPVFTREQAQTGGYFLRGKVSRLVEKFNSRGSRSSALTTVDTASYHVYDKDGKKLL